MSRLNWSMFYGAGSTHFIMTTSIYNKVETTSVTSKSLKSVLCVHAQRSSTFSKSKLANFLFVYIPAKSTSYSTTKLPSFFRRQPDRSEEFTKADSFLSEFENIDLVGYIYILEKLATQFFEPTCANARWALMHRFLSVRLSVCHYTKSH